MPKAIISTTYSDTYLYFLPIVTYCWNKLGVDVICFMPRMKELLPTVALINQVQIEQGLRQKHYFFDAPEDKEATYSQCARLYAACLDLPEDEVLVTGDIDMALFKIPEYVKGTFSVFGTDLVPDGQVPICYLTATVKQWRDTFNLRYGVFAEKPIDAIATVNIKTYQQCLDELLGSIECENMRGNYWSKDQQEAHNKIFNNRFSHTEIKRARPNTQFASNRIDRDDSFWEERLNLDIIDAHLWRPGYTEENFPKILKLLKYFYPNYDFKWLVDYTNEYRRLL